MYQISCCSTVDLPQNILDSRGISYLPMTYEIDGKTYKDDLGHSMSYEEFYTRIDNGALPTTSQVNPERFILAFKSFLEKGLDILHISLSSGLSGTFQSAKLAANILLSDYPDRKILVVDSLGASTGSGLLVLLASDMQKSGADIDETYQWLESNKLRIYHLFSTENLKHLYRGGRLSATGAVLGSVLNICPTMYVDNKGKLKVDQKVRGMKKVIMRLCDTMEDTAEGGKDYSGYCIISYSQRKKLADDTESRIRERFTNLKDIMVCDIGCVIGSHLGPGGVAVFYLGKEDRS